jgi:hypothetical protein
VVGCAVASATGAVVRVERIGDAVLYLADCRDVLPALGKAGAVVADPPYGINFDVGTRSRAKHDLYAGGSYHRSRTDRVTGDDEEFDPSPFLGSACILWGAHNYAAKLPPSNGGLVWHKDGGIKGFAMSECELAWTNVLSSTRHISHMWHGFKRDSEIGQKVEHPTQKPIAIMQWCLGFVPAAEVILDPYMGSGTTGVAAAKLGRKFIGVEIDPGHFETACRRIEAAYAQPDLFVRAPEPKPEQLSLLGAAE